MTATIGVPGRALDALVAEEVFGWLWLYRFGQRWFGPPETVGENDPVYGTVRAWDEATFPDAEREDGWWLEDVPRASDLPVVPHFSTDIVAAWLVVAKMREHPDPVRQNLRLVAWSYNRTYALFGADDEGEWSEGNGEHATPTAICLAALQAAPVPAPAAADGGR